MSISPPLTPAAHVVSTLRDRGWAALDATNVAALGVPVGDLRALAPSWNELPRDAWLKDGGAYRKRRHACFIAHDMADARAVRIERVPHRAHYQSVDYNALHGGIERWFEPMHEDITSSPAWTTLLQTLSATFSAASGARGDWFIEAHPFRIDALEGIGRPTPEGAHRDGVDFVALFLVAREGIKGGETRVFEAHGANGVRFTLSEPWSVLLLDDARVIHETTPIQPAPATNTGSARAHRDTLVLTFRRGAFQSSAHEPQ